MTFNLKSLFMVLAAAFALMLSGCMHHESVAVDMGSHHHHAAHDGQSCHDCHNCKSEKHDMEGKTCQSCKRCQKHDKKGHGHDHGIVNLEYCCSAEKSGNACYAYNCGDSTRGCVKWCSTY